MLIVVIFLIFVLIKKEKERRQRGVIVKARGVFFSEKYVFYSGLYRGFRTPREDSAMHPIFGIAPGQAARPARA